MNWFSALAMVGLLPLAANAQMFAAPDGGWAYTYDGVGVEASDDPFASLDGSWDHDNGSDQWDGSGIGDGNPGGVSALTDGDTNFIRVQDAGDPRSVSDLNISDPGSNRKVYLTHNLFSDFEEGQEPDNLDVILDDGITLYFRTRVATAATGPIDDQHSDGTVSAWPEEGLGYWQHISGKSVFAVKQTSGANIAFGLDYGSNVNEDLFIDEDDNPTQGLILPHILPSNDLSGDSDPNNTPETSNEFGQVVPVEDITEWQEFWVTIEGGTTNINDFEDGTHIVNVYHGEADDPLAAQTFGINAASGSDYRDGDEQSYLAIGAGATPRAGAFDLDFFSWAPGLHVPSIADVVEPPAGVPGDIDGDGSVAFADFLILSNNFGNMVDAGTGGDIDGDGSVAFADFLILSNNFGSTAAAASVPEPTGWMLFAPSLLLLAVRRRRR